MEQTIPLWGKLGRQRKMAMAEADAAAGQRRAVETELAARIKVVFANAYATEKPSASTRSCWKLWRPSPASPRAATPRVPAASRTRSRPKSSAAGCRRTSPVWRRTADLAAQLNALLNRPVSAPLAPPACRLLAAATAGGAGARGARRAGAAGSPQLAVDAARITADRRAAGAVRRNSAPSM